MTDALSLDAPAPVRPDGVDADCWLACIDCGETYPPFAAVRYSCDDCGGLLEVRYADLPDWDAFSGRGVWRYAAALPFETGRTGPMDPEHPSGVSLPEGDTPLYELPRLEADLGVDRLRVKHEGMNPTGSFKDRGMTVGVGAAAAVGVDRLACASTGNTSAALAAYGARAGLETLVLLPAGKVAAGKVAQAALHDARILEVDGNFDDCLDLVQELATRGEAYLLNSLNPFRLEGQKTIGLEILEQFRDEEGGFPDRVVLPVGNAGNTAALYKCFRELVQAGALAREDVPKLTGVQAAGAAPFVEAIESGSDGVERWEDVETRATAIRIGEPVNAPKALPGVRETGGTAVAVDDDAITAAQRDLAREGVGVEPASAASIAGLRELRNRGVVDADERVVCLTTGHLLKDPEAAAAASDDPEPVANDVDAVLELVGE
ncbi:threonine synthase [Halolamina rubra]|uniref:threonine synthase n=1 Tax=Halolamina rubra TaxID=1380430 RepID=UPI000678CB9E|nr:threonine synthase [Halolamina rubra]